MGWKFWQHDSESSANGKASKSKLPGPKEISQQIGMHLITVKKLDPDLVWNYKMVVCPTEGNPTRFDFRIFSPDKSDADGVRVSNFHSLDNHANLINFSGWLDKKTQQFEFHKN